MTNKNVKIKNIILIIVSKLRLYTIMSTDDVTMFCESLTTFLERGRFNSLLEKDNKEIESMIDKFTNFMRNIGLNSMDIVTSLYNNFLLLEICNKEEFLDVYRLLCFGENEDNTLRRRLLVEHSSLFNKDLNEIYARYMMIKETGRNMSLTNLIKQGFNEFKDKFVIKTYLYTGKGKLFKTPKTREQIYSMYPIDYEFLKEVKSNPLNNRVSYKYRSSEMEADEKRLLAIDNFSKVKNLEELSNLLGFSTSSLQRYLKDDAKQIVSKNKYEEICKWLANAKYEGLVSGGKTSQELHGFSKDEIGKFKGSKK